MIVEAAAEVELVWQQSSHRIVHSAEVNLRYGLVLVEAVKFIVDENAEKVWISVHTFVGPDLQRSVDSRRKLWVVHKVGRAVRLPKPMIIHSDNVWCALWPWM